MNNLPEIRKTLERAKPYLVDKYHLNSIALFGSVLRADFSDKSDVDIIVEFSKPIGIEFIDLADELESLLTRKIDLVSKEGIKPGYFKKIEHQILYVQ